MISIQKIPFSKDFKKKSDTSFRGIENMIINGGGQSPNLSCDHGPHMKSETH